jgi:ribonuclease HII
MRRGEFIERIKAGQVIKCSGKWLDTPKAAQPLAPVEELAQKLRVSKEALVARIFELGNFVLDAEIKSPTPAGKEMTLAHPTLPAPMIVSKWGGKNSHGEKESMVCLQVPMRDTGFIHIFLQMDSVAVGLDNQFFAVGTFSGMKEKMRQISDLTPNKYAGSKTAKGPASGKSEELYFSQGVEWLGGIDEAGRGAYAGPLVASIVALNPAAVTNSYIQAACDSKSIDPLRREELRAGMEDLNLPHGLGVVSAEEIDQMGIDSAHELAFYRAVDDLKVRFPEVKLGHILVDGTNIKPKKITDISWSMLPQAEQHSFAVAAASIFAKTEHDRLMKQLDAQYPGYGFGDHQGYGTKTHATALLKLGPCPQHRFSFKPVKEAAVKHGITRRLPNGQAEFDIG